MKDNIKIYEQLTLHANSIIYGTVYSDWKFNVINRKLQESPLE